MLSKRTLKLNTGQEIPAIGLGTYESKTEKETKIAVLKALEVGYTHIDCAWVYGNEREIGEALREAKVPRSNLFLVSKLWNTHHRPELVEKALDQTLSDLGVSYLDLYLMHSPLAFIPSEKAIPKDESGVAILDDVDFVDTWIAMEKLLKTGKVKAIGVSNFNLPRLKRLLEHSSIVPAVNQIEAHPLLLQEEVFEFCKEQGIHITAFSPLGGQFQNKSTISRVIDEPLGIQRGQSVIPKSSHLKRIEENFQLDELPEEDFHALSRLGSKRTKRFVGFREFFGHGLFEDDN
ncbi:uncharacterized protein VTP21DRAFT_4055 [Calcarisporiella thermophila]|uniref:uncharacterized protein n=1 Tax=Calcarisporiella thermophila TaxID=911321 RepID=UPI003742BA16